MKIDNSKMQMQAASTYKQEYSKQEQMRVWTEDVPKPTPPSDVIHISAQGLKAQKAKLEPQEEEMLADKDYLKLKLIERVLTKMSGREFKFRYVALDLRGEQTQNSDLQLQGNATQLTREVRQGWGLHYQYSEQYTELEQMTFQANGSVALKDGRQIDFSVALHMSRSYSEAFSIEIKAGDALKDPLVVDLSGQGIAFSNETMHFDLDFDGTKDNIPILSKGNGYLVIDRNHNQMLDDGSELFGPRTNHGFAELAAYDQDQNDWIDENDDISNSLKIWVSDGDGEGKLVGMVEAGIGAIFLGRVKSEFQFKDLENNTLGKLKQTGVYLKESGTAGIIQEVDLRV